MQGEITYPCTNFNGAVVDVREWTRNLIQQFTGHVIAYPAGIIYNPRWYKRNSFLIEYPT